MRLATTANFRRVGSQEPHGILRNLWPEAAVLPFASAQAQAPLMQVRARARAAWK